jgi:hypothetical protein
VSNLPQKIIKQRNQSNIVAVFKALNLFAKPTRFIFTALLTLSLFGCSTIKLTAAGEKVGVRQPDDVASCLEVGKSKANVTYHVLGIERPEATMQRELSQIARNGAAKLGGDTVVPLTVIKEGVQTFLVYNCNSV